MSDIVCEECRIGRYQATTAPYLQWVDGRMLVFPDAPAYTCDVCRYMKYDVRFVQNVEYVLNRLRRRQPVQRGADKMAASPATKEWRPSPS